MIEWNERLVIDHVQRVTKENMQRAAYHMEKELKEKLSKPGTGKRYKRGNKVHVASAPGQPPATDDGILKSSINNQVRVDNEGNIHGVIGSDKDYISGRATGTDVEYGFYLEMGTRKMKKRPWLISTFLKNIRQIRNILNAK